MRISLGALGGVVLTLPGCVGASHLLALPTASVGGGTAAASLPAAAPMVAVTALMLVSLMDTPQDGRCGDDTDCAKGEECRGPAGATIGRCVAVKGGESDWAPAARRSARTERPQLWCDPTESPKWRGASFEEKELLYDACLTGTGTSPL